MGPYSRFLTGAVVALLMAVPAPLFSQAPAVGTPARTIMEAPDQWFSRGDARLRFREAGRGQPVVLLHGYTQRIELMQDLADSLSGSHRVIVLDQRGFGESTKYSDPARFGRPMLDDVVGLLDHLRIQRAHVVGHSMGALVAAGVALKHPRRVASATLIAGPFFPDSASFAAMSEPWVAALQKGEGLVEFGMWILPGIPRDMMVQLNAQLMAANDLGSLIASFRAMGGLIPEPGKRPDRSVPVLVVAGGADPLAPQSRELRDRWPGVRYLEAAEINHDAVRAHGEVVAAIRQMIRQ